MEFRIDFSNKRTIVGLIALVCGIALILYLPSLVAMTNPEVCTVGGVCQHEIRVNLLTEMIPVFVLGGIIIGAVLFFFMSSKIESQKQDMKKITSALVQFLNKEEKMVVQRLLENNGRVLQSEISRIEGIGKLKSHRVIQRLSDRGVIEIEKHGKTNIVKLQKNISEVVMQK